MQLYDVAFGKNTFLAVGENGTILQSGVFSNETTIRLTNVALANGRFQALNHSQAFWLHLRAVCPSMEVAKRWLKLNRHTDLQRLRPD